MPPLIQILLAKTAAFFTISIPALFAINDFMLPFIGIISLYALFLTLSGSKKSSILFAVLFYFIFIREFNRPINPQFIFIVLILGIACVKKIYFEIENKKETALYSMLLALSFSVLLYSSFYFWSSLIVIYF